MMNRSSILLRVLLANLPPCLLALSSSAQSPPPVSFALAPERYGSEPTCRVRLGDLDADGDLDAVFANMGFNSSQVMLNNGNGVFVESQQELTEQGHGVGIGDLDADGDLDLFMTCAGYSSDGVVHNRPSRVYLNLGNGTFVDSGQDLGDTEPSGNLVQLADVDHDGDLDAFVYYYQAPAVVYLNDGNAGFTASGVDYPAGSTFADLDGDQDVDLFVKDSGIGYRVRVNDGHGGFSDWWSEEDATLTTTHSIAFADLDHDGDVDGFDTNGTVDEEAPLRLLLNDGTGRFTVIAVPGGSANRSRVVTGDVNNDTHVDAYICCVYRPNQVWLNDGSGGFIDSGLRLGDDGLTSGADLGDLDGDGDLDVLVARYDIGGAPNEVWINCSRVNRCFDTMQPCCAGVDITRRPGGRVLPRWCDDSEVIAFCSDRDGDFEIYVMSVDGCALTQLTDNDDADWAPAWSPDATEIAFASDHDGDYEIYVMNADGSEPRRLTDNLALDFGPVWSSDGMQIAFSSDRDGLRDIYLINRDGTGLRRLTNNGYGNDAPDLSKDGGSFLFRSVRNVQWQVFTMDADGYEQSYLTDGTSPDWSPGGASFTFESDRTGHFEIYTANANGSGVGQLTYADTFSHEPDWSPDGSRIAYWSSRTGNGDIWVMSSDGSDSRRVTFDEGVDASPAWKPVAPPVQLWDRVLGGPQLDTASVVRQTSDGGFIVGGATVSFSAGGFDIWLNRLDSGGQLVWQQTLGGTADDDLSSIEEIDGGYILAGLTESYGSGDEDFWLIRIDENGTTQWSRTYGGTARDRAQSVQQTPDGGFVVAGATMSFGSGERDVWLVCTDEHGDEIWSRSYGGPWDDKAYTVLLAEDGGYIFCGNRGLSSENSDAWLVKVNRFGDLLWERSFGGDRRENAYWCQHADDGGFILGGYTYASSEDDQDAWIIKTDELGEMIWNRVLGGSGTDNIYSLHATPDGGCVTAGLSSSFGHGGLDIWLGRTDGNGNLLWTQTLGGSEDDLAISIDQTSDGGYIVAGYTSSFGQGGYNGWVVRLASERW